MDINNLKYNMELFKTKKSLERQLKLVNSEIGKNQDNCKHIKVILGYVGAYAYRDTIKCRCLLCNSTICDDNIGTIDAITYKRPIYSNGFLVSEREERLLELQKLTLDFMKEDHNLTEVQLIEKLKEVIEKDEENNKQLEKTLDFKMI